MKFIKVAESAESMDDSMEIPVEPEGHIPMSTLIAQFSGACGLKFKTERSSWRGVRVVDDKLLPTGDDTWNENIVYVVTYPKSKSLNSSFLRKGTLAKFAIQLRKIVSFHFEHFLG